MAQTQSSGSILPFILQAIQQGQTGYNDARKANEARRDDILKGLTDTRQRVIDAWNGYGSSLVDDTNAAYDTDLKNSMARLSQLGMLGSTNVDAVQSQNTKARLAEQRRVQDDLTRNRTTADERLSNNIDQFKERITDEYPESNSATALASLLGSLLGSGAMGGAGGLGGLADPSNGYGYPASPFSGGSQGGQGSKPGVRQMMPVANTPQTVADKIAQANAINLANSPPPRAPLPWQMDPTLNSSAYGMSPVNYALPGQYEQMPALGIFGAKPLMSSYSDGGYGYSPQQNGYGYPQVRPGRGTNSHYQQRNMSLHDRSEASHARANDFIKSVGGQVTSQNGYSMYDLLGLARPYSLLGF